LRPNGSAFEEFEQLSREGSPLFDPRHVTAVLEYYKAGAGDTGMQAFRDRNGTDPIVPPHENEYGCTHPIQQSRLVNSRAAISGVLSSKGVRLDLSRHMLAEDREVLFGVVKEQRQCLLDKRG
jgi:hypothetical protein